MRIVENTTEFQLNMPSAVAIGKFDGIHRGHRRLLENILEEKRRGRRAVVFTFEPSPYVFFSGKRQPELTTKEEKRNYFRELGIDILIEYPMTAETAAMPAEAFIRDVLAGKMNTVYIAAGEDLSFGDRGLGNAALLRKLAEQYHYETRIIDKVCLDGTEISSTYVRETIAAGNMEKAEQLLGMPYSVSGVVAHGKRLGRRLGMPTVNLLPPPEKLLPPYGVYFSQVEFEEKVYKGITNIGSKPTVNETGQAGVETYLYDFTQEIYGKEIVVSLFSFKRPERKFDSVEALKIQMAADIAEGRYYHHRI